MDLECNKTFNDSLPKTKGYHHGDLRKSILEHSIILLKEKGPQSFSFRELASRIGVSSAAPYRHFKTKEEIFAKIAEEGFKTLYQCLRNAIDKEPLNPIEQLHSANLGYFKFAIKSPEHLQMMFGNILTEENHKIDPLLESAASQAFFGLLTITRNCQLVGALDPEAQSEKLAIQIWSAIHGFATLHSTNTLVNAAKIQYDPDTFVRAFSENIVKGLSKNSKQ